MTYVCELDATGCSAPGNPTRAENGQEAERVEVKGSLADAVSAFGRLRGGRIYDDEGDLVAEVRCGARGRIVLDAEGDDITDATEVE